MPMYNRECNEKRNLENEVIQMCDNLKIPQLFYDFSKNKKNTRS